jgi:Pyridine nucleotide-disulphide oxidoreductase
MSQPGTIAIIGAGPVGLAAAAHAHERGWTPIVLEAGPEVGHAVRQWGHVRMFSPWDYNIDGAAERLLDAAGWNRPAPGAYPMGDDLARQYLEPLATRTALQDHIHTSARVTGVSRVGFDKLKTKGREAAPFLIRYRNGAGPKSIQADAVIDASGTWNGPNPAGANGLVAIGEEALGGNGADEGIAYGMPDVLGRQRNCYAGKRVAVLGSGHSAIGLLIDLARLAQESTLTRIVWLVRGDNPAKAFGGGANDKLAARGALGLAFAKLIETGRIEVQPAFSVTHLSRTPNGLRIGAGSACCGRQVLVDQLIVATGFRPDTSFLRELRIALDPALECPPDLAPLIDPNAHSCGTVRPHGAAELRHPEPGFYIAGMKAYGRAPTFLALTGYEQVRSIVAEIAGDHEAAGRVELVLPETGVCNTSSGPDVEGCCGGPPVAGNDACCRADEAAKAAGKPEGCAPVCGSKAPSAATAPTAKTSCCP